MSPSLVRSAALAGAVLLCACNVRTSLPPSLVSTTPADGATEVAPDTTLEATFDRALDPASVTAESFVVDGIPGTVRYDADRKTAVFTPSAPLPFGAQVLARLTPGLRSDKGAALEAEHRFSFTVAAAPFAIASVVPLDDATGVSRTGPVLATFSADLDPASLTATTFTLTSDGATEALAATLAYDAASRTASLSPAAPLAPGARYTAEVKGPRSTAGAPLSAAKRWSFTASADVTAPKVTSTLPANGAIAVGQLAKLSITFDEPIAPASLAQAISVSNGVTGTVAYDAATRTARLTPAQQLPAETLLTVTVGTGVTNVAGNPLAVPYTFSFTTEKDTNPPRVVSSTPAMNGSTELKSGQLTVTVTFSEPLLESTLASWVDLFDPCCFVSRTLAWNAASRTLTVSATPKSLGAFTLRLGSEITDLSGNKLGADYLLSFTVVDTTPPELVQSFPSAENRFVSPQFEGSVTFDEAIDLASAQAAFTIDGVSATVSMPYSFAPGFVTVAPASNPLARGQTHTLVISTALKDKAGNRLAAPIVIPFTVLSTGEVVSGPSRPFVRDSGTLAFSENGDGLALWRNAQSQAFFARFSAATGAWSPGVPLGVKAGSDRDLHLVAGRSGRFFVNAGSYPAPSFVISPSTVSAPLAVTSFMFGRDPVVASGDGWLLATFWQTTLTLQRVSEAGVGALINVPASGTMSELALASTADRTVVGYVTGQKSVQVREVVGETVGAETTLATLPADASPKFPRVNFLRLAAEANAIDALWEANASNTTGASTISFAGSAAATAWSAPVAVLSTPTGNAQLSLVVSGSDVMAAADPNTSSPLVTARRTAGIWGAPQSPVDASSYEVFAVAGGFALRGNGSEIWLSQHGASGWAAPTTVTFGYQAGTFASATTHGLVFLENGTLYEVHAISGGYSSRAALSASGAYLDNLAVASGPGPSRAMFAEGGQPRVRELGGSGAATDLVTPGAGRVGRVRLASATDGTLFAAWTQDDLDLTHLYARARAGGVWGPVLTVDTEVGSNDFRIATDGARFGVAWQKQLEISTRTWSAGALGAKVTAATLPSGTGAVPVSISSNGSAWGLLWATASGAQAAVSADPSSWGSATPVGPAALATSLRIAGRAGGFAAVTSDPTGLAVTLYDGAGWQGMSRITTDRMRESWNLAAGEGGYVIAWGYGTTGVGGRFATWTPASPTWAMSSYLVNQDSASSTYVTARGSGFAALVGSSNWFRLDYAGGQWSQTRSVGTSLGPNGTLLADPKGCLLASDYGLSYLPDNGRATTDDFFRAGAIAAWSDRYGLAAAAEDGLHFVEF